MEFQPQIFQDFLDSPGGVERTGCKTINNVVMKVDLELTGGSSTL